MKRLFASILAVFLVLMMSYQTMAREVRTEDPNVFTNKNTFNKNVDFKSDIDVTGTITTSGGIIDTTYGTGDRYFVDSGVAVEGDGTSWSKAKNTVDEAINLCTANNGDIIYVAQGHAESFTAADGFDADVAGITIIMLGNGEDAPEFTFADTDATIAIGAANVTIIGGRYIAGISDIVIGIAVEAGGDNFTLYGAEFPVPGTNSFEFLDVIDLASGADGFTIENSRYRDGSASATNHFIEAGNGVNTNMQILSNDIQGRFAVSGIWSDAIDTGAYIANNTIRNDISGQHAIEFTTTANGMIVGNRLYGDTEGSILDPGSMYCLDNLISTGIDVAGVVYPTPADTATNFIGVDDNNNVAATTNVASNRDGSILERLEFIAKYLETGTPGALVAPADTYSLIDILGSNGSTTTGAVAGSLLGAIGTDEASANTPFASTSVQSDRDGSVLERLEFLNKYFETGTAGGLVAPADTRSLLDILGSDGSTTTGAVAGSILGAIGTNEASASTDFASGNVQADADGSVLEREEYLQTELNPLLSTAVADTSDPVDMSTELVDNSVMANMLTDDGDSSDYDRRLMSLERLAMWQQVQMAQNNATAGSSHPVAFWFVDPAIGSSGDGKTPFTAFATIDEAITASSNSVEDFIIVWDYSGSSGTITINKSWIHLLGMVGSQHPYPRIKATTGHGITLTDGVGRIEIAGFTIGGQSTKAGIGLDSGAASQVYIHDCHFGIDSSSASQEGIYVANGADLVDARIEHNEFKTAITQQGIEIAGVATWGRIKDNLFIGLTASDAYPAIDLSGGSVGIAVEDNRIGSGADDGAGWAITLGAGTSECWINNNYANDAADAVTNNPFLEGGAANGWGMNYKDIRATIPD